MRKPQDCQTMSELREAIDVFDRKLMDMLVMRASYIDRASELKPGEGLPARIPERVEQVAANARVNAQAAGLDPDFAETLWRQMIEWSIAREEQVLGPSEG